MPIKVKKYDEDGNLVEAREYADADAWRRDTKPATSKKPLTAVEKARRKVQEAKRRARAHGIKSLSDGAEAPQQKRVKPSSKKEQISVADVGTSKTLKRKLKKLSKKRG